MLRTQHRTARTPRLGAPAPVLVLAALAILLFLATACTETQADIQAELGGGDGEVPERLPEARSADRTGSDGEDGGLFDRLSGDGDRPQTVQVPAGTRLTVSLDQPAASHVTAEGQSLRGELAADVTVGERIVLPAGSIVWGTVERARPHPATETGEGAETGGTAHDLRAGNGPGSGAGTGSPEAEREIRTPPEPGEPALLEISFEHVETGAGRRVPISATLLRTGPPEPSDDPTAGRGSAEVVIPVGTEVGVALERATSVELPEEELD